MALSFLYLMARWLVGILPGRLRSEHAKDIETAVLRQQLRVLGRQVERPSSALPIREARRAPAGRGPAGTGTFGPSRRPSRG